MFSSNASFPRRNYDGGSSSRTTYNYGPTPGAAPDYRGATSGRAFPSMDELRLSEQAREANLQAQLQSRQFDSARYGIDSQRDEFDRSLADQQAARQQAINADFSGGLQQFAQAQLARAQSIPQDNKGDIAAYLKQYQEANESNLANTAMSGYGVNTGHDVAAQGDAAKSRALAAILGITQGQRVSAGNSGQLALRQAALGQEANSRKQAGDQAFMQWLASSQGQGQPQQGGLPTRLIYTNPLGR